LGVLVSGLTDVVRVLRALPAVEIGRRTNGLAPAVARFRERGRSAPPRAPSGRARLQRIIRLVDRCMPGGGNCYRRVLLEIALDRGAAAEPVRFGLREHGGPSSGHVWLADRETGGRYDAEFVT
jgi:hypothetical protein